MKKSVAMKWVKALRSGKYKQGKGKLQDLDAYCCLGVLCEVAPFPKIRINPTDELAGETLGMQPGVRSWAGFKDTVGALAEDGISLAQLNDGFTDFDRRERQLTFDEIADIIQICWEEL